MSNSATNGFSPWWPLLWLRIIASLWLDQRWYWQHIQPDAQDRERGRVVFSQTVLGSMLVVGAGLYLLGMLLQLAGIAARWSDMLAWSGTVLGALLVVGPLLGWARGTSVYGTCGVVAALEAGIAAPLAERLIAQNALASGRVFAALLVFTLGVALGISIVVNDATRVPYWRRDLAVAIALFVVVGLIAAVAAIGAGAGAATSFLALMLTFPMVYISGTFGIDIGMSWAGRQRSLPNPGDSPADLPGRNQR